MKFLGTKTVIIIIFLLVCNIYLINSLDKGRPKAIKGILDLSNWDFDKDGSVNLNGEWEFYWNKLLTSEDFKNKNLPEMTAFYKIPGQWNNAQINGKIISNYGCCTYRLTILLKPNYKNNLALKMMDVLTAFSLYVNGKKIGSAGQISKASQNNIPQYKPQIDKFYSEDDKIEIILQVANYNNGSGGVWDKITLGSEKNISKEWENNFIFCFFLLGAIIMIGLYHLGLYLIRRNDKSTLYFCIFCLFISLRLITTGETFILNILPEINWEFLVKLEYFSFYLSVPVFVMFIHSLFPERFSKIILYSNLILGSFFTILVILTPVKFFSYTVQIYQIITILTSIYIAYFFILLTIKKIDFGFIFLIAFFIMLISLLNDILYSNGLIISIYTIPIALFIFIFFESFVLSLRFSKAFLLVEKQKKELAKTNIAYEKEINERIKLTKELVESNNNNLKARLATILGLAKLAEFRDEDTGNHLERIREYTRLLAIELKFTPKYKDYISEEYVDDIYYSSILHDIGKVGIPDEILLKKGKLTPTEFKIIKKHPVIGGKIISAIESKINNRTYLTLAREIAFYHHEKWNGSGYPKGLKSEKIPLSARIIAVADVYDALISKRIYKKAFTHKKAVEIINAGSGSHFDPYIVEAFNNISFQFNEIQKHLK